MDAKRTDRTKLTNDYVQQWFTENGVAYNDESDKFVALPLDKMDVDTSTKINDVISELEDKITADESVVHQTYYSELLSQAQKMVDNPDDDEFLRWMTEHNIIFNTVANEYEFSLPKDDNEGRNHGVPKEAGQGESNREKKRAGGFRGLGSGSSTWVPHAKYGLGGEGGSGGFGGPGIRDRASGLFSPEQTPGPN
jgi:hypothetical protein